MILFILLKQYFLFEIFIFDWNSLFQFNNYHDKEPIVLYLGNETTNSLNNKSKVWQALASQLYDNNNYKCNIKDCLFLVLKLKSLNLSKKSFTFIITDGLFKEEDKESLNF